MHEIGIMQSALSIAEQQARAASGARVHVLRLRLGQLSGVVPDALRFAFEALRPGTLAAEASLEIEEVRAVCWCARCQAEFAAPDLLCECPRCQQPTGELRRGTEIELASLEIS